MLQRFAMLLSAAGLVMTAACSQSDAGITTAVKAKMAADDTVKAYQINVDAHNHVVTLNGRVDTPAAKDQAVLIARNTKGVNDVIDDITVERETAATRGDVESKVDAAGRDISEKTAETTQAVKDTAHDAKVKTEEVAHDAKVKTEHAAEKTGEVITDAAITAEVKTKFLAEPGVSGLAINVDTNNGVVTLNGTVTTKAEANKAVSIARMSKGVKRVVSHLKVAA